MRLCLYGFGAVGLYGVFVESWAWGLVYVAFLVLTVPVMLNLHCCRCPYPYEYETCIAMPDGLMRRLVRRKDGALGGWRLALFITLLAIALLFPQYWLWRNRSLFIAYWVLCAPTCVYFPFCLCRRCRYSNCPFHPGKYLRSAALKVPPS